LFGELDLVSHGAGLFVGDHGFRERGPDVGEGDGNVVEVGERRRVVVAVAGEDVGFVGTVVVEAIVLVGLARGAAEASVAEAMLTLLVGHTFLSVAPSGAG